MEANQITHLFGTAEPHPHFEASQKQLHHLVVLQVDGGTVHFSPRPMVVSQQSRDQKPQQYKTKEGETEVKDETRRRAGGGAAVLSP